MHILLYPITQEALERWSRWFDTDYLRKIAQTERDPYVAFYTELDCLDIINCLEENVVICIKYDTLPSDFTAGPVEGSQNFCRFCS